MSIRKVNFVPGEYYHIYNRGNSKQVIFKDDQDYKRFVSLLYISNTKKNFNIKDISKEIFSFDRGKNLVAIGSWVLMPNHFHLLITQIEENGISKFMQKLTTAYSMYYNKKYKRTGVLFEGKFKAEHVNNDRYLKYLFSYIHLNPVKLIQKDWKEKGINNKAQAIDFLKNYKNSSYLDYLEEDRVQNKVLNKQSFPKYFSTREFFLKEIFEWLSYTP